jgi:hypothetical protein
VLMLEIKRVIPELKAALNWGEILETEEWNKQGYRSQVSRRILMPQYVDLAVDALEPLEEIVYLMIHNWFLF